MGLPGPVLVVIMELGVVELTRGRVRAVRRRRVSRERGKGPSGLLLLLLLLLLPQHLFSQESCADRVPGG